MDPFGILLKSYGPDLAYAERFMASYSRFVEGSIPVYAVVPDEDVAIFTSMMAGRGTVLPESLWVPYLVDYQIHGNAPGYVNQEIIKLAFHEHGILENYLCADSEAVFLRPFSQSDFMADEETPFTFVTADSELRVDPIYWSRYGESRDRSLVRLREFLDIHPFDRYETCHGFGVFSSVAVASLSEFLQEREMTYADALEVCPYEFSWYNFWLEKSRVIPRVVREPIFYTLHIETQHLELALKEVTEADLSRGYVGAVLNSGFSRLSGVVGIGEPRLQSLGRYTSISQLTKAVLERALRRAPRVRRALRI